MDGTIGCEGVQKSRGFHSGRNYRSDDGVNSQKWMESLPSAQELTSSRCIGKQKVSKWIPSRQDFLNMDGNIEMMDIGGLQH